MPVVLAPVLIPLLTLLLCLFLWAASQSGQTFFRELFQVVGVGARRIPIVGQYLGSKIDALINRVVKGISGYALTMEQPVVAFFLHLAALIEGASFSAYYTAARTLEALQVLRHSTIPRLLRAVELELVHAGGSVGKITRALEQELGRDVAGLQRLARSIARDTAQALRASEHALQTAVTGTLPRALPWLDRRAGSAEAAAERALRGLRDVRNLLAAGVFAGLVVQALGRLGVANVRCNNARRYNRQLCGMSPDLFEALLGDGLLILGGLSLVEIARECEAITGEAADLIHRFLKVA